MHDTSRARSEHGWSRIDGIDCLRALAILLVLMNHVNMRLLGAGVHYLRGLPPQLANSLVWNGQQGVQIFFAVSGFLITMTSIRRWGERSKLPVGEFYLLRFARIAPLLFALLAVLSALHLLHVRNFVVPRKVGGLRAALVAALTLRVGLLEAVRGYLPGNWDILWSLSVEELFYLGFPLAWRLLGRGRWLVALLIGFVAMGPFARTILAHGNETWQEYSYLGGMDAIALGCLTALALTRRSLAQAAVIALTGTGLALLIFCLGFSNEVRRLGLDQAGLGMTVLAIGTCMLIAAASQSRWRVPQLISPLLSFGRRSYEIYLTHMFIVFLCFDLFMSRTNGSLRLVPIVFVVAIGLAGGVGEVVGRFYSEPANRWIRRRFARDSVNARSTLAVATVVSS